MSTATIKMRSQDAMKKWAKHKTPDLGAGTASRRALVEHVGDDAAIKRITDLYGKVVKVLPKGMATDEIRACLFSAASDYSLPSLIEKAKSTVVWHRGSLGTRDKQRIEFIRKNQGEQAAEQFETMLVSAKQGTAGSNGTCTCHRRTMKSKA